MKVLEKIKQGAGKIKTKAVENKDKLIKGGLIAGGVAAFAGIGGYIVNKLNGDYDEYYVDEIDEFEEIELTEVDPNQEVVEEDDED